MTAGERPALVLDASAVVELILRSDRGHWLRDRLDLSRGAHAPELMLTEAATVLRRYQLHGAVASARVGAAFERLLSLPVQLVRASLLISDAWALRHSITVADACYVVLAQRLDATLVTCDERLARAPRLGVPTLVPPPHVGDDR